jgi:hypothetical protein
VIGREGGRLGQDFSERLFAVDDADTRGRRPADGEARRRHLPNLARQGSRKPVVQTPAIVAVGVC